MGRQSQTYEQTESDIWIETNIWAHRVRHIRQRQTYGQTESDIWADRDRHMGRQ